MPQPDDRAVTHHGSCPSTSDLKTGEELFALNSGDLTLAASTTKLWSTATALDV